MALVTRSSQARKFALGGVSVVAPNHIGKGRVASDSVNHADPDQPILARLRAGAANGTVLWLQSDAITGMQCHGLEQPAG